MLQNKKYPFFFQGGRFLPATPFQVEISFKFHIKYFLFDLAMKTPSPYNFSNNANIPYAKLSYNIDFKAQQGKIGKKIYFQSQGRSQEETTTEANTRSVVRNQPYEIF